MPLSNVPRKRCRLWCRACQVKWTGGEKGGSARSRQQFGARRCRGALFAVQREKAEGKPNYWRRAGKGKNLFYISDEPSLLIVIEVINCESLKRHTYLWKVIQQNFRRTKESSIIPPFFLFYRGRGYYERQYSLWNQGTFCRPPTENQGKQHSLLWVNRDSILCTEIALCDRYY